MIHSHTKKQEIHGRLKAALEQVDAFKDQLHEQNIQRAELEQKIQEMQSEHQEAQKALEESLEENSRSRCTLELISK